MPLLGQLALWLALLLAVWGVVTGFAGATLDRLDLQESARRATIAAAMVIGTALVSLIVGALQQDFHLAYIAAHADRTVARRDAWVVVLDGWAGQWLVVGFVLATGLAATSAAAPILDRRALSYGAGVGSGVLLLIVVVVLIAGRLFDLQSYTPLDGQGLSQRLYDFDARVAALVRCVAYAGSGVAAAWLAAGVLMRRAVPSARVWALIAWVLLTADLSWSLLDGLRENDMGAALRPALVCWVVLTAILHGRRETGFAAHVTHVGALFVAAGLVVTFFRTNENVQLRPGETVPVAGFDIRFLASSVYPAGNQIITQGLVEVSRGGRSAERVATVSRQQFDVFGRERGAPAVRAGSWHGLAASVHVRWTAEPSSTAEGSFDVTVVPFAPGLILGCWLLGLGGLAALWPARSRP